MAKGENQKLKLFYLAKILQEKTDEEHSLTRQEIQDELQKNGVSAERKSLYDDLRELDKFGIEVVGEQEGREYRYKVVSRLFELAELKLLVDAIQSSKFITEKKSRELIKKLESMVSEHQAKTLRRQVFVQGRIKTMNESIYYSVDTIHSAIAENRQIRFQYYAWNIKKETELRHGGKFYNVSPLGLSWDDENYYLVAFDGEADKVKHFRVDKMLRISMTDEKREGASDLKSLNMADYAKINFGMFGGEETAVTIEFDNRLVGVLIDRFGKDISIRPVDKEHSRTTVHAAISSQFFGWLCGLGDGVKITGPEHVVEEMREFTLKLAALYGGK